MSTTPQTETAPEDSHCYSFLVRRADRHLAAAYDRALQGSGLRTTQLSILRRLDREGATTMSVLAGMLGMDRTTLTAALKPLARDGLVSVTALADRRVRSVDLTALGRDRLAVATPPWESVQQSVEGVLGAERAALLRELLDEVVRWEPGEGLGR